jgi:glycosyltransferase EpsE
MISILLATYNGKKYIEKSIESILNQTFKDFELLIAFNGTTDNSKELILKYNDRRIRIFDYGDEKGKSITLNKLLKECKYDWCAIQDDDDIWLPNKIEEQIKYINDYDVIGTLISYIDEMDNIIGSPNLSTDTSKIITLSLSGNNQIANTSTIFKKSDAIEINGWKDGLDGIEDFDFWLRLIRNGKNFINIPQKLVLHRLHNNSNFNTKKYDINKIL